METAALDRFHAPAVVLVVVGFGLLLFGGGQLLDSLVHERTYTIAPLDRVEGVSEDDIETYVVVDGYGHYAFSDLSESGQRVVVNALESADRSVSVTGQWNFPEEFYPSHETGGGAHFVSYEGAYYLLEVEHDGPTGPFAGFAYLLPALLVCGALLSIAIGGIALLHSRPLFPTAVGVGLGYPGVKYVLHRAEVISSGPGFVDSFVVGTALGVFTYGVLLRRYRPKGASE